MIKVPFRILGKSWKLKIIPSSKYEKKNGKDSAAISKLHKRRVDVRMDSEGLSLETLVHELVHCYLYEMCIHSTDISVADLEEVFAELMSHRGYELLEKAEDLLSRANDALR